MMDENEQMMSQRQENEEDQPPVPEETMQIDTTAPKKPPTPEEMKFLRSMREDNTEIPADEGDIDDSELVNKLDK